MDRRLLYKSTLQNDAVEKRRNFANKYRSDNRSKAFSNRRKLSNHENSPNILQQQSSDKQNQITTSSSSNILSNLNKIHDKKLPYIERYRLWKKEKENHLKEEREKNKIQKPFISTVRPTTDKYDIIFKLPAQPPIKLSRIQNKIKHHDNQIQIKTTIETEKNSNVQIMKKLPQQQQQNHEKKNTAIIKPFSRIQQQQQKNPTTTRVTKIKLQPPPLPSSSQKSNNCTAINGSAFGFENNSSSFITTDQTNHDFITSTSRKIKEHPTNNATFILSDDEIISPIENSEQDNNIIKETKEPIKKENHQNNDVIVDNKNDKIDTKELKINNKRNRLSKNLKHKIQKSKQPSDYLVQLLKKAKNDYVTSKANDINDLVNIKPEKIQQQQQKQKDIDTPIRRSSRLLSNKKPNNEIKNSISTPVIKGNSLLTPKLSTSKQTRLQKIVQQQQQRSRSDTPQRHQQQQQQQKDENEKSKNMKITKTPTRENKNYSLKKEQQQQQFNESTTTPTTSNKNRSIQKQQNRLKLDDNIGGELLQQKNENNDHKMNRTPKIETIIVENDKTNKDSSSTNQNVFNTPPQPSSTTTNLNNSSSNYLSPFVTVSRGKVSARKEKEKRDSLYKLELSQSLSPTQANENSLQIRRIKEAIKYFRQLLKNENERLNECCNKWELYKNDNNEKNDNCNDMINVTIGQARLLLNKKMKQFNELINKCEQCIPQAAIYYKNESTATTTKTATTEQLILTEDLEGFWSMVCLQIDNIDKRFENLEKWKSNNWNDPDEIKQIKKKQNIKTKKQTNKSTKATNVIRDMIKKAQAEHAKKRNDNISNNDDLIFVTKTSTTPLKITNQLTPLRRSARLSNKKDIPLIKISSPGSSCSSTTSTSTRYSTSKQTRIQKIVQQQQQRSRSNTPQQQQQQQQQLEELTEKLTIKTPTTIDKSKKDAKNVTSQQKSCLKQSNVRTSVKRNVAFSKQLATITFQPISIDHQTAIDHNMSGIDILNVSDC